MFTINELKKHLGPGLGLRKNKYLLEIPVPNMEGEKINVLCRSAGLPERNITPVHVFHKGRKYNIRGETDYTGTYEVSIVDDSKMAIRALFDNWLKAVDDSMPANQAGSGASYETHLTSNSNGFGNTTTSKYQVDINIWQLASSGNSTFNKLYGYKIENAFPSSIGIVTLEDGDENTLSEFSVTFTFSEFIPLKNNNNLVNDIIGFNIT